MDKLVQRLKFNHALDVARILGQELEDAVKDLPRPDLVVAMPLSDQRLRARGFNQSFEIARHTTSALDLPLIRSGFARVRDTPAQMGLSRAARRKNMRAAFQCTHPVQGLHVAVVDDVMTSGATLDEFAGAIKHQGASSVTGWIVARTPQTRI